MRVLSRSMLARYLGAFAVILVILVLAVAFVETLADLDELAESAEGLSGAFEYMVLRTPAYYLPILIPVASFAAAFGVFGTAARDREIVALKAGGISPLRVVLPVLASAAILSCVALLVNETVAIRSHEAWRRFVRGDATEVTFRRGSFWYHTGRYIYNVADADASQSVLRDVAVFELDEDGHLIRMIQARRAEIAAGDRWRLIDAVIRRFDPGSPGQSQFERVAETEVVLSEERALLDAGVEALSIQALREVVAGRPEGDPEAVRAQALLHERLSQPMLAFVFALVGIPLGLRVEQSRTLSRPALHGVVALLVFFGIREYGGTLATSGVTAPGATVWAVVGAFTAFGAVVLARVPR